MAILSASVRSKTADLLTPNFPAISEQVRPRLSSYFNTISVNFHGLIFRTYSELFGVEKISLTTEEERSGVESGAKFHRRGAEVTATRASA
jgi:Zn-dependent oligopeptidase